MTVESGRRAIVIGIGNTFMGDDGIGPVVARALQARMPEETEVVIGETAGMALMPYFLKGVPVLVVDALSAGAEPGAIFRFTPDDGGILELRSNTLHGCGLPYLVTTARLAGIEPDVTVYAVQVGDVHPDPDTLTPSVSRSVAEVVRMLEEHISRLKPLQVV